MGNPEEDISAEGIINELRKVISHLHEAPDPTETEKKPSVPPEPLLTPQPPPPPSPFFNEVHVPEPTPKNAPPSDKDFWSGNVLGWPADAPVEPMEKSEPMGIPEEPEMSDPFSALMSPEPPKPRTPDFPSSLETEAKKIFPPIEMSEEPVASDPMPESQRIESPEPSFEDRAFIVDDVQIPDVPPVPIPGTMMTKEEPEPPKDAEVNLETPDQKLSGMVQISCIFPEGEENKGQQFVSKLKEAGEKLRKPMHLEAVFISAWNLQNKNPKEWMQSSKLSGAEIMFVICFKKDMELFKDFASDPVKDGIATRYVMMEHIGLRTLYPDILIEIERRAHGKN